MNDELLTIEKAIYLLNLDIPTNRHSVNVECPVCGNSSKHHEKKMNINFDKDVFRCPKCGIQGAAVNFWAMYRGLSQNDLKEASKDYFQFIKKTSPDVKLNVKKIDSIERKVIDVETATSDVRNNTYQKLIGILTLSDSHRANLRKRGLSDEEINKKGYRSYPLVSLDVVAQTLLERGCILRGCPGFYTKNGKWTMLRLSSGIMIPQRDGFGRIQGFQVRLDEAKASCRYLTLSTAEKYENGSKGFAYAHFAPGQKGIKDVIITEGPLKGDIIAFYTGYSVLALQGVNSQSFVQGILEDLKAKGTKNIFTAFDMDLQDNVAVQQALSVLQQKIEGVELTHQQIVWDSQYKGFDDWLSANRTPFNV